MLTHIIITIMFFFALFGTVYFFGSLITWHAQKVNPKSFGKVYTVQDIKFNSIIGSMSCFLWAIVFFYLISR